MDGADWIRSQLTGFACAACGRPYRRQRIRVLAQREELFFVDLACAHCGSEAVAIVSVDRDDLKTARVEMGGATDSGLVSAADVLAMHRFLREFDGDFHALFDAHDERASGMAEA